MVPRLKVKDDTVTTINVQHRVLKYDVIKNYICEIMGVGGGGGGILGEQHSKGLLAKISIPGHIVFEMLAKF